MRRFLIRSSVFAAGIVILLCAFEIAATAVPNPYKAKDDHIKANGSNIELLVLGSSHSFMGINPSLFGQSAYSLANVSQSLNVDAVLLEKYIDKMPKLRQVVISISLFSFYSDMCEKDNGDKYRLTYYRKYMDVTLCPWYENRFEVLNISSTISKIKEFYVQRTDVVKMTDQGQSTSYFLPNKPQFANWESAAERAKGHTYNSATNEQLVESLNRIATLCEKRGAELILVTTPTRKSYYELLDSTQIALMHSVVGSVVAKYKGVYYYDFLVREDFQQNPDYFYDADHLTDIGADYFTSILVDTLSKRKI